MTPPPATAIWSYQNINSVKTSFIWCWFSCFFSITAFLSVVFFSPFHKCCSFMTCMTVFVTRLFLNGYFHFLSYLRTFPFIFKSGDMYAPLTSVGTWSQTVKCVLMLWHSLCAYLQRFRHTMAVDLYECFLSYCCYDSFSH